MKLSTRELAERLTKRVTSISLTPPVDPDVDVGDYIRASIFTAIEDELLKVEREQNTKVPPGQAPLC